MDLQEMQEPLELALSGDEAALARLVGLLTPVVQSRVARVLLLRRRGAASGRDIRQEVEDLAQEVFLTLFADGGRVLRGWRADRGLSLANFVGLVAERQAASILRSGRRSPWRDDPTLAEDLDVPAGDSGPEAAAASREQIRHLLDRLTEELSPLGRHLFDLIFLRELSPEEVAIEAAMTPGAVYAWRSRLRRLARRLLAEPSEMTVERRRP